jgi:hypothetical protein
MRPLAADGGWLLAHCGGGHRSHRFDEHSSRDHRHPTPRLAGFTGRPVAATRCRRLHVRKIEPRAMGIARNQRFAIAKSTCQNRGVGLP